MLSILPLDETNRACLNQADTRFLAGDRVQLRVTRKGFTLEYVPLPNAEWRTLRTTRILDANTLLADEKAACFLAFLDGQYAGQAVTRLAGHRLCELMDLRVDSRCRRQGVGTELLKTCVAWTEQRRRAGLRAETSDESPVACQFLESCGFALGGVDRLWHNADPWQQERVPGMRETVLTFYRFF